MSPDLSSHHSDFLSEIGGDNSENRCIDLLNVFPVPSCT